MPKTQWIQQNTMSTLVQLSLVDMLVVAFFTLRSSLFFGNGGHLR